MAETICHKFLETSRKHADAMAVMYKRGDRWNELSWQSYREVVESIAAGFQILGVRKGDRVAILSNSRLEWAATDMALLGLGAVTVPIYQSSSPEDVTHILHDSEAKVLVCETPSLARRLTDIIREAKSIEHVVCFEIPNKTPAPESKEDLPRYFTLDEIQAKGGVALKKSPTLYDLAVRELDSKSMATLIYTSGTTGKPKGVVLTHTQILSEVADAFPLLGVTQRDRSLSFLPYAHVLGRIEIWGHALIGHTMAFAQSIERMKDDLVDVKPTIMVAVPRVFEKIYNGIMAQAEVSPLRAKVFHLALSVGKEVSRYKSEKRPVPMELALRYQLARRLVFNKISEKMGGNLRFAVCGGAPLSQSIAEFFHAAGLLILEGYGLTETTAAITANTPFDYRFGTVGRPIGDVRIKIADDGEILVQSKKVMKGYYRDDESNARSFTDGWFQTGDIGEITPEGYLRITDRKKDLIKTAGGKYVAPQRLEGLLKTSRYISQVHIHGDQRKYIVALLTLNMEALEQYASEHDIPAKDKAALVSNPKIKDLLRKTIAETNVHLASFESIKNFALLPEEFTIEAGELTPSLKVKRKVVDQKYRDVIDSLYS
jgi:long-chain acyl-CoA synthetase